MDGSKTKKTVH